jgi:hypothetical protein
LSIFEEEVKHKPSSFYLNPFQKSAPLIDFEIFI